MLAIRSADSTGSTVTKPRLRSSFVTATSRPSRPLALTTRTRISAGAGRGAGVRSKVRSRSTICPNSGLAVSA